jgi:hypothetical protein
VLERYISILMDGSEVFLFLQRNQAFLRSAEDSGKHRFEQFRPRLNALLDIIAGPDAPPRARIRAASAIFAAGSGCMFFMHEALTSEGSRDSGAREVPRLPDREELRKIMLEIADDLTHDLGAA